MFPEKTLIWNEIKKAAPDITKDGGNPIEILLWSQGKTLDEVKRKLKGEDIGNTRKNKKEIVQNRVKANAIINVFKGYNEDDSKENVDDVIEIKAGSKIRELVETEEKNFISDEKDFMLGLVSDD